MLLDRSLYVLTIVAWTLFGLFLVAVLIRSLLAEGVVAALRRLFSPMTSLLLLAVLAISALSTSLSFIQPQEVGVVVSLLSPEGMRDRPYRSGLHWLVPVAEEVYRYPIYWQTYTMSGNPVEGQHVGSDSIAARTSDGQEVYMDSTVIFQIDPEQVLRIHVEWQDRYVEDFIRPLLRGLVRSQVSQFTVDEVNSFKRLDLEALLSEKVEEALEEKGFVMDRFILRNISFSDEYAAAVEAKQVAQQNVLASRYNADRVRTLAEGEADAIRTRALAEQEALQLIAEAIQENPELLTYRYIEKLSPGIQVMLVPNDTPFILPLPELQAEAQAAQADAEAAQPETESTETSDTPTP